MAPPTIEALLVVRHHLADRRPVALMQHAGDLIDAPSKHLAFSSRRAAAVSLRTNQPRLLLDAHVSAV